MNNRIYVVNHGNLSEVERLELARLLIKAGYTVRLGRERPNPKSTAYRHYVEYGEENECKRN